MPGGHCVGSGAPARLKEPAGLVNCVGVEAPPGQKKPAAQGPVGRLTALPSQKLPAWHGRQALAFQAPVTLPKVPGPL